MVEGFIDAVKRGDDAAVESALAGDPELASSRDASGLSAVLVAAYNGHTHLAHRLAAGRSGRLPLFDAAVVGDADAVVAALREDAEVDMQNTDGYTALHLAAFFGQLEVARVLLESGADPNAVASNESRVTPLHSAVAGRHRDVASLLLVHAAAPNAVQRGGFTPLHSTAQNGDDATSELLLLHGADPTLATDDGRLPADLAEERGFAALAEILRQASEG